MNSSDLVVASPRHTAEARSAQRLEQARDCAWIGIHDTE
jgi:hypothetical protein